MRNGQQGSDPDLIQEFGKKVSFGKTTDDYATHRAGFPRAFFDMLELRGWVKPKMQALDIGTGTGTVARGLHASGCTVTATDPSPEMLAQARLSSPGVTFQEGVAERLNFDMARFDLVTAGQCWHWFQREEAAGEILRVLKPAGRIVIAHFDWLPLKGNMVAATEALILKYNPDWSAHGGAGVYPAWLTDLGDPGFEQIETASFDIAQPYTHEAWRGRIRASAGVAASLNHEAVQEFDTELAAILDKSFPANPMQVPHRVWLVTATKP